MSENGINVLCKMPIQERRSECSGGNNEKWKKSFKREVPGLRNRHVQNRGEINFSFFQNTPPQEFVFGDRRGFWVEKPGLNQFPEDFVGGADIRVRFVLIKMYT